MYSAPSIVLQSRNPDGSLHVFDDFREAYAWMRYNTPADSKVASWCANTRDLLSKPDESREMGLCCGKSCEQAVLLMYIVIKFSPEMGLCCGKFCEQAVLLMYIVIVFSPSSERRQQAWS